MRVSSPLHYEPSHLLCHMNCRQEYQGATHFPVCHGCPGTIRLVELPDLYAMVEGAGCETDTIEIVCGISYEISVSVLYQASLHGSKVYGDKARLTGACSGRDRGPSRTDSISITHNSASRLNLCTSIHTLTGVISIQQDNIMNVESSHKIVLVAELSGEPG